ncbi:MAG TPA: glucose-6-phosphate dehydrogenase assembly protein OpcA [Isosphaeraceae bacterium]|nr:glucose-6-phosphate dehydrogenase assembly protein OpcA [Isosphaeraceae bacterium]
MGDERFLQGHGIPVAVGDIEAELATLWGPAAEGVDRPEAENPNVTRVVLANLVVVAPRGDGGAIDGVIDTVVSRFPSRAIVLRRSEDGERKVAAEVTALCHLPAPGRPQVCSERIALRAGPNALDLLPGAVRPLLEPDLPRILWWADDLRGGDGLFGALAAESTRVLLDPPTPLADPTALRDALEPAPPPCRRDAAWHGITRWRELVAQLFDPPGTTRLLHAIDSVEVRARVPRPDGPPRVAAWLVAWLAGQLGWRPRDRAADGSSATFDGPSGQVAVRLVVEADPAAPLEHLAGVTLTSRGNTTFRLTRPDPEGEAVRVEAEGPVPCPSCRTVLAPEFDAAGRIAAALESDRRDPPFCAAMPHALWLLGV